MKTLLIFLALCTTALGQSVKDYDVADVILYKASAAEILPGEDDSSVLVLMKDAESNPVYGKMIKVYDQENDYLETYDVVVVQGQSLAVLPPTTYKSLPDRPGEYLVTGKPGQKKFISIRSSTSPVWFEIEIKGRTTPDPEPDPDPDPDPDPEPQPGNGPTKEDLADVTRIAEAAARSLNDPLTKKSIADSLSSIFVSLDADFGKALAQYKSAIANGLLDSPAVPPYKDWQQVFRVPLSNKLESLISASRLSTSDDLAKIIKAIVDGLTTTETQSSNVITMYTRDGCSPCKLWLIENETNLVSKGWIIKTLPADDSMTTPAFEVICNGKRYPNRIVGYMDMGTLTSIVKQLSID